MSEKRIKLVLALHNHQPVGNFDFVFEEAYEKSYLPFLEVLERHPSVRLSQHFTGPLFEWLQERRPDFLKRMAVLVENGQVEMISGGFYEPILSVIPERDRIGQIEKMNQFIERNLGYKVRGLWLAERIWEPNLPSVMAQTGVNYVVLDDSHFKGAGLNDNQLYGYYLTEDQGHCVSLFPIIEKMRYNIPFADPEDTIAFLQDRATPDGARLIVYADDGEKFGIWPNTYEHCYQDGWVEKFCQALEANSDWIELVHLSEALDQLPPLGKIYLPTGSYREMLEWAMPTAAIHEYEEFEKQLKAQKLYDRFKVFVKGGFWRNFMTKYAEANQMHKRMLSVSRRLEALQAEHGHRPAFGRAQDLLWASQCNCPYWHGVFGGLYLSHLRYANFSRMVEADVILDKMQYGEGNKRWVSHEVLDLDSDGHDEIVLSSPESWLCFSPHNGGSLIEFDFKKQPINLLDTMTRREEAYHKRLRESVKQTPHHDDGVASIHDILVLKEEGLEKKLHYDWYRRVSFIDHFLGQDVSLENFARARYAEAGDFVLGTYHFTIDKSPSCTKLKMQRQGNVRQQGNRLDVRVEKQFSLMSKTGTLVVDYGVHNLSGDGCQLFFGPEMAFALLAGDAPDRYYKFDDHEIEDARLCSIGEVKAVSNVSLIDQWLGLDIQLSWQAPAKVWRFPIETISQSESGFERVYQNSVVLPLWPLNLATGDSWHQRIELHVMRIDQAERNAS